MKLFGVDTDYWDTSDWVLGIGIVFFISVLFFGGLFGFFSLFSNKSFEPKKEIVLDERYQTVESEVDYEVYQTEGIYYVIILNDETKIYCLEYLYENENIIIEGIFKYKCGCDDGDDYMKKIITKKENVFSITETISEDIESLIEPPTQKCCFIETLK